MGKIVRYLSVAAAIVVAFPSGAIASRCPFDLIDIGDRASTVIAACGEQIRIIDSERAFVGGIGYSSNIRLKEEVVERWLFMVGAHYYIFAFRDGRLSGIKDLGRDNPLN